MRIVKRKALGVRCKDGRGERRTAHLFTNRQDKQDKQDKRDKPERLDSREACARESGCGNDKKGGGFSEMGMIGKCALDHLDNLDYPTIWTI